MYTTTSPLLIGTRLPDPSTQSPVAAPVYVADEELILVNRSHAVLLTPLSSVNFAVGLVVPIPTFEPLSKSCDTYIPIQPVPNFDR